MMNSTPSREFHFTEQDFEKIRKLIYDYAGIALSPTKHDMVYGRLARRLRALGLTTFQQYLQILERGDSKEFELFTNSLTTNLTSLFRESHHFDVLRQHLQRLACALTTYGLRRPGHPSTVPQNVLS